MPTLPRIDFCLSDVNAISGTTNTIIKSYIYTLPKYGYENNVTSGQLSRFSELFSSLAFAGTVIGMLGKAPCPRATLRGLI